MENLHINREENYKHRNLGLHILSRALDDICPKFEQEPENVRTDLIKERQEFFSEQEVLLDKEWEDLEKEALQAVKTLTKEREQVIKRLRKSKNTNKLKLKVKNLKRNRDNKTKHLKTRLKNQLSSLNDELKTISRNDKKFAQIKNRIANLKASTAKSVSAIELRYQGIIDKVNTEDNTKNIEERIQRSEEIWAKKYTKLKEQYREKEEVFDNRRYENDQVRKSLEGFIEEFDSIEHLCIQVGVEPKVCYLEVKARLKLLGRNSNEINDIIDSL